MEEKYIRFYISFHKAFQNKKSYSLFKTNQSLLNKARFPGWANLFNFLVDILSKQFPCFLLY